MRNVQKFGRFIQIIICVVLSFSLYSQTFDLIIRNGKIMDGTGNPWYYGDVAIEADLIVAMGNLDGIIGSEEIDATGLTVCPGFIDIHSHADGPFGH